MAVAPEQLAQYPDESTHRIEDAGPLPAPPDWATYIPTATLADLKNQEAADAYATQAQGQIADLYGRYADWQTQQTIQAMTPQWGEPRPTVDTTQPATAAQEPAPDINPVTAEPASNPVVSQFLDGLGGLFDKLKGAVVQPGVGAGVDESSPLGPAANPGQAPLGQAGAAGLAAMQTEIPGTGSSTNEQPGMPDPASPLGPPQGTPNQTVASELGNLAQAGLSAADAAPAAAALGSAAARAGLEAVGPSWGERLAGDIVAGSGVNPQPLVAVLRKALTADHPIVQAVADASEQAGAKVDPAAIAKLIASKGFDPENLAKASGRLGPTKTAALAAWKAAQDPEMAQAIMQQAAPAAGDMAAEFDALPSLAQKQAAAAERAAPLEASAPSGKTPPTGPGAPIPPDAPYTGAGTSLLAENPVVKGLNAVQGVLKQAVIGGSIFHPLVESAQLGRTALAEAAPVRGTQGIAAANRAFLDSGFAQRFAADNADTISRAEQAGATMVRVGGPISPDVQQVGNRITRTLLSSTGSGIAGYASAKAQGQSDQDALKRAGMFALGGAGVAQIAPALNAALWGRMVPVAKVEAFKLLEPSYGAEVAAKRINDIFGGQNLAQLGRNSEVQTILRSTFLAPDWLESWARNLGAVVKPGPEGTAARKWWAATGISSALALEGLNTAITGHPTTDNEPGRQLQLEITPLLKAAGQNPPQRVYADVLELGPLGSVLNAANRGGLGAVGSNLATGHLNVLPDIALQASQNRAPTGGQIVSPGTPAERAVLPEAAAAAAHVAPIGLSTFEKGDLPLPAQAASAATGIRLSEGPAVKQTKAASSPFAAPGAAPKPPNLSNLHTFLGGPAKKSSPFAPAPGASNLSKLKSLGNQHA